MRKLYRLAPLFMIVTVILLQACSAKKNTAGSRFWQALNTRYNVYYHGKTNYDEQIKELEDNYQDDYSQRLFLHPAEAKANPKAPQPSGSFDRTIEKMQKAIALHSIKKKPKKQAGKGNDPKYKEWMKREEYNPFLHNAWYLLAKAEYMKGDFLNSAATFRYISRHFQWKPDLCLESQIWEALCYCAMGWTNEADNVLAHIHIEKIEDKRIRALANLAFADYYVKDKKNDLAVPYLVEAVKGAKGQQKVRLNFLLGQLYEEAGNNRLAYEAFKRAGSSNSSTYRTKFNARIKQSAVFTGVNVSSEVKALRNMARFDRNKEYLDQIYYAIGNLYLTRNDTVRAIENYIKAAEKSTRNGVDKAISQLTLGGIYFAQHKYDLAQPCYAEAVPLINEDYPNYKMLKHRSDVLDELAVYSQNVTLQDSLLKLSQLPIEEQKKVIQKIIDELKKKEKEEKENAEREAYMAQQNAQGNLNTPNKNAPQQFQMNTDNSWYFYNDATKRAGKTAFQQSWGNRKLEDNWRRRNKNTFSLGDETAAADSTAMGNDSTRLAANDSTHLDNEAMKRAEDPHYEEYYLKQIPSTEEQVQAAHDIIVEGLYNMGVILKDKLEDPDAAEHEFNELLRRYPDNIYRLDTYYNMYLMYMRYGQVGKAETCRDTILTSFADSKYGQAMQDPDYLDNLKNMERDQEIMYAEAYDNYLNNNNEAVHAAYAEMMRKYPLSKIMPKFMFIDALSYVTQKNYDQFKSTIKEMLQRYPETDITPVASGIVKQLNSGRKLHGGSSNTRGMIWSTRLGNDSTAAGIDREFTPFKDEPDKPHSFILLYPTDSVSSNMLLYEVARHNFNSFVVKDYDIEQMTFSRLGLLVVKGFENYNEAVHYRTVYEEDKEKVIPDSLTQVIISDDNFKLLINEGRSFEDYFNWLENKNDSVVEGKVPELKNAQAQDDDQQDDQPKVDTVAQKKEEAKRKAAEKKEAARQEAERKKAEAQKAAEEKKAKAEAERKAREEAERKVREEAEQKAKAEAERKAREEAERKAREEAEQKAAAAAATTTVAPALVPSDNKPDDSNITQTPGDSKGTEKTKSVLNNDKPKQEKATENKDDASGGDDKKRSVRNTTKKEADEKDEAKKKEADLKKAQEEKRKQEAARKKQQEEDRKKRQEEMKRKSEEAAKQREAERKAKEEQLQKDIKQEKAIVAANEKDEQKRLKELEKAEKAREKAEKKREKQIQDSIKRAEKEAEKLAKKLEKARNDSIAKAEMAREDSLDRLDQQRLDARRQLEKSKAQQAKEKEQAKIDAKKQAEKERKERMKAKEEERKLKEKERKEKAKERERLRKEREKQRKEEAKQREKEAKQKQKEREEAAKQKQKEREAAAKQKEQERKEAAKQKEQERKNKK